MVEGDPNLPSRTIKPAKRYPFFQAHFITPVLVLYERGHLLSF